jgi:hypothetical protein
MTTTRNVTLYDAIYMSQKVIFMSQVSFYDATVTKNNMSQKVRH